MASATPRSFEPLLQRLRASAALPAVRAARLDPVEALRAD
jgi:hypothetical protein